MTMTGINRAERERILLSALEKNGELEEFKANNNIGDVAIVVITEEDISTKDMMVSDSITENIEKFKKVISDKWISVTFWLKHITIQLDGKIRFERGVSFYTAENNTGEERVGFIVGVNEYSEITCDLNDIHGFKQAPKICTN